VIHASQKKAQNPRDNENETTKKNNQQMPWSRGLLAEGPHVSEMTQANSSSFGR
jgi:hypothetical protein